MELPKFIKDFYGHPVKRDMDGNLHSTQITSLQVQESLALYQIVKKFKPKDTLEIGFALGGSAVAIINAKIDCSINNKHIVLDPFQLKYSKNAGVLELDRLGIIDNVEHRTAFSEDYLSKAYENNLFFDFIFIDGSHTIGQAVTDAFLSDKVMRPSGIIGIHDSMMFSTASSIKYLINEKGYKVIGNRNVGIKTVGRQIKYGLTLGLDYCMKVIPKVNTSITFIQKP